MVATALTGHPGYMIGLYHHLSDFLRQKYDEPAGRLLYNFEKELYDSGKHF